jgi:hypothetical protein
MPRLAVLSVLMALEGAAASPQRGPGGPETPLPIPTPVHQPALTCADFRQDLNSRRPTRTIILGQVVLKPSAATPRMVNGIDLPRLLDRACGARRPS